MPATLEIERKSSFIGGARKAHILLDHADIGYVKNGREATFQIPPGKHSIAVQVGSSWGRSTMIDAAEGEVLHLTCRLKPGRFTTGDFILVRKDGGGPDASSEAGSDHGVLLMILAIASFFIGLLGLAAFGQGLIDLGKMRRGEMDASRKGFTLAAMLLGVIGCVVNMSLLGAYYWGHR